MFPVQELMGQTLVVNTPPFFTFAWAVIQVFLDERVRKKVVFFGKKDLRRLQEHIAPEFLPTSLGGTSSGRLLSGKDGDLQLSCAHRMSYFSLTAMPRPGGRGGGL